MEKKQPFSSLSFFEQFVLHAILLWKQRHDDVRCDVFDASRIIFRSSLSIILYIFVYNHVSTTYLLILLLIR